MGGPTQALVDFVQASHFDDLPQEMVHETKRILLDSIGVAIAALKTDKGRYGLDMAKRLGGPAEASIIGSSLRASFAGAAFANGELINALDYDAMIFPFNHAPPAVIPSALAIAEMAGASGKDLILATALNCELSTRLSAAVRGRKRDFTTPEGSELGKIAGTKDAVSPYSLTVIAGTLGAGKIARLDPSKMAYATGVAAQFAPLPSLNWRYAVRIPMAKYLATGWASMAQVMAVTSAEMGCTAETGPLDGNLGMWRFFGGDVWDPDALTRNLGREWMVPGAVEYKAYPCALLFSIALDRFIEIIEENNLTPEDIEKVSIKTFLWVASQKRFMAKEIVDHLAAQFSLPYAIAAAAHRVSLAEWQDPERLTDPNILQFMDKVFAEAHPDYLKVSREEPESNMTSVEVVAKGKVFKGEGKHARGFDLTDEDLVQKFRTNATKVLPQAKVEKAISIFFELEKVESVTELVGCLTP
ncbi:MAG: MmgE/PrpD family protein [Chloroflexi bacterium]|nr:MmgE/PrpD family protein [Chloroflexota bacterium]